jgi:two-component system, cell cycle response regulator
VYVLHSLSSTLSHRGIFGFVLGLKGLYSVPTLNADFAIQSGDDFTSTDVQPAIIPATATSRPTLQILTGLDAGRIIGLKNGTAVIGRAMDSQIVLADESVSRQHAEIYTSSTTTPIIYDLESKNGTRVNGHAINGSGKMLVEGDQVQLSTNMVLKFSWQKPAEEALQGSLYQCAIRDWLTQAHNKKYFIERCAQEFSFAQRHGKALTLLLIDIDHFKQINDSYGHDAGDHVLKEIAKYMTEQLREEDFLARYGGEEFAILLRQIDLPHGVLVANRLRTGLKNLRLNYLGKEITCTTSIGVACTQVDSFENSNELFIMADKRLYRAKESGRDCTVFEEQSTADSPDENFSRHPTTPPNEM